VIGGAVRMSARFAVDGAVTGTADGSTFCGTAVRLGTFCVSKSAPLEIGSGGIASMIAGCAGLPANVGAGNAIVCDTASLANPVEGDVRAQYGNVILEFVFAGSNVPDDSGAKLGSVPCGI
jgi:hypothetical protein